MSAQKIFGVAVFMAVFSAIPFSSLAQDNVEQSAAYVSQVDQDLTIRRVGVLPVVDNVQGIYARPAESQLVQLLKSSHKWDYVEISLNEPMPALIELEENPDRVLRLTQNINVDAFLGAAITRNANGLSLRLDLFLKKDGKVLLQEVLQNHPRSDLPELRAQLDNLYRRLIARLPYEGLILSRQHNRVTVNLGEDDGLKKDQIITAVQIISLNRHPKFNFIISSEKAILGKIKILKVDKTLSFGAIVSEKERGAIRRFAKVTSIEPVTYPEPTSLDGSSSVAALRERPDAPVTFGQEPKEWLPTQPPSFGAVGLKLGLGNYTSSVNLDSVGALEANSPLYPNISAHAELWLTPEWTVRADLLQGVLSTNNPRTGSSPGNLNHSSSRYSFEIAYNFLLKNDFFGPKLLASIGYSTYRMYVDDSNPRAFTTTNYSGLFVGLGGSLPITDDKLWYVGGKLNFYLSASLDETPVTSGANANSSINEFSIFVERQLGVNLRAVGSVDLSLYSTNFSGQGSRPEAATTLSQSHKGLSGGIVYMF